MVLKYRVFTEGMTCSSCEERLSKALGALPAVQLIEADFTANTIVVEVDSQESLGLVQTTAEALGYPVRKIDTIIPDANRAVPRRLSTAGQISGLLALAVIVLLLSPRLNFNLGALDSTLGYGALFMVGLLTSVHCIGMCGGINMAQCISYRQKHPNTGITKPSLLYNGFRVLSYTAVGALAGALGSAFNISGNFKGIISVAAGMLMIVMGFNLLGLMGGLRRLIPKLPTLSRSQNREGIGPVAVGVLNGLMPCGPLQAMQLYALATGSPLRGAMAMLVFGLGTFPAMFAFGSFSTMLSSRFTGKLLKASGVLVIVLGIIALDRGAGFLRPGGSTVGLAASDPTTQVIIIRKDSAIAIMRDGYQEVRVNVWPRSYQPVVIQQNVPVRLTFVVEEGNLNGCNNAIVIPSIELEQRLSVGDTMIEFTMKNAGEFRYICWMNMIRSTITVVPDLTAITP